MLEKSKNFEQRIKLFDKNFVKNSLYNVSLFSLIFEQTKSYLITQLRSFYSLADDNLLETFKENKYGEYEIRQTEYYKNNIFSLDKSELKACLLWYQDNGVINQQDFDKFQEIINYRNFVVHETIRVLTNEEFDKNKLLDLKNIFIKIEKFWIQINIETDIELLENLEREGVAIDKAIDDSYSILRFYFEYLEQLLSEK